MGCMFDVLWGCTVAPDARRIARSGRLLKLGRSASSIQRTRPHPDRCGWRRWTLNTVKNTGLSAHIGINHQPAHGRGTPWCKALHTSTSKLQGAVECWSDRTLEFDGYPEKSA